MKAVFLLALLVACAYSAPQGNPNDVQILRYDSENLGNGYKFSLETSDGTVREEQGELKNAGTENEILVVQGSYSWVAPDGQKYTVTFVADENGFQPVGDHLPKNP